MNDLKRGTAQLIGKVSRHIKIIKHIEEYP